MRFVGNFMLFFLAVKEFRKLVKILQSWSPKIDVFSLFGPPGTVFMNIVYVYTFLLWSSSWSMSECLAVKKQLWQSVMQAMCVNVSTDRCGSDSFRCKTTKHCISKELQCNRLPNCGHGDTSDETHSCMFNVCYICACYWQVVFMG